jgi:hypothetical protein
MDSFQPYRTIGMIETTDRKILRKSVVNFMDNPKADTSQLENQIDQLVYKLYNLTPEEIKIIEDSVQ